MKAIEIQNLSFSYNQNKDETTSSTLDDISLDIEKGEYVTIIGHNGSGKSTLAKLIVGLIEKHNGTIKIFDQELNEDSVSNIRQNVGIVFQNPDNQFIGATVRDDIAFGLENQCVPHENMDELINCFSKKVNMIEFLDKEPSALSGGQKQRVAIAGVLAMNPKIIIFDEATAMLDPRGKNEIISLIHKLKNENSELTILSITHDIEEAYLSDRCIVLDHGKIFMNGNPKEIFGHEDELLSIGLDIPFAAKVIKSLKEADVDIQNATTLEEVSDILCQ